MELKQAFDRARSLRKTKLDSDSCDFWTENYLVAGILVFAMLSNATQVFIRNKINDRFKQKKTQLEFMLIFVIDFVLDKVLSSNVGKARFFLYKSKIL